MSLKSLAIHQMMGHISGYYLIDLSYKINSKQIDKSVAQSGFSIDGFPISEKPNSM